MVETESKGRTTESLHSSRFFRFLIVGGVATATHYLLALTLFNGWGWSAVLASSVGFVGGAVLNYVLNARFTFGLRGQHAHHAPRFAVVAASGWVFNAIGMWVLPRCGLDHHAAQILVTVSILFSNFALNALWAMRAHPLRTKSSY